MAPLRADRNRARHSRARDGRLARVLRFLSERAPAGEPDAGAARLLWRAYLPSRGSRRRVPYGVDQGARDKPPERHTLMTKALDVPRTGALDFLALGALIHRLDPGVIPFRKAATCEIHVSGGAVNTAANLAGCFGLRHGIAAARGEYTSG